jgi:hypothetical protein
VVFLSGFLVYLFISKPLTKFAVISLVICCVALALFSFGFLDSILSADVYYRGGISTRVVAWSALWRDVQEAPILGHGELPRYVENSWLRGWSAIGLVYPLCMALIVGNLTMNMAMYRATPRLAPVYGFCALFAGLTAGSVFEGYLFDANSMSLTAWFISLSAITLHLAVFRQKGHSRVVSRLAVGVAPSK